MYPSQALVQVVLGAVVPGASGQLPLVLAYSEY
jgi:hypothetical protein